MQLFVKRLSETAKLPTKAHPSDAGWDLYADEDVVIYPGETCKISTGIAIQLPEDCHTKFETAVSLVWDRGSLGSKGISHTAGVIDYAYNGEIFVCLTNLNIHRVLTELTYIEYLHELFDNIRTTMSDQAFRIKKGDKIAQIIIQKVFKVDVVEVDELRETDRGDKCLGSSGK